MTSRTTLNRELHGQQDDRGDPMPAPARDAMSRPGCIAARGRRTPAPFLASVRRVTRSAGASANSTHASSEIANVKISAAGSGSMR